jgi:hypothetical protein
VAPRRSFPKDQRTPHYLWHALDQDSDVLDILVQSKRNKKAAKKFFCKLLKGLRCVPRVITTVKLKSYGAAKAEVMPGVEYLSRSIRTTDKGTLFGMSIDDLAVTPKQLYRYEVCFASDVPFNCADRISKMEIPSKTYGVTRISGDIRLVATAWD